jgi:acyl dehydratase
VSHRRTITETDVVMFTSMTGINDPVFTDAVFAEQALFKQRAVPGPLQLAYALGLTEELVYGSVDAALGIDEVRFEHPVFVGDTLHVRSSIVSVRASRQHPDKGVASLHHDVLNQDQLRCSRFDRTMLFMSRTQGGLPQ